jgi:hypothetical protein
VFEDRVVRKIFGPKRDEETGDWRKLHNEELHNLNSSPSIIRIIKSRRMRWTGHVARMGEKRNAYRLLVGEPEGRRPLGRPRHRWVDNIKMDLSEIGWDRVDWIDMAQNRDQWRALVNTVFNLHPLSPQQFSSTLTDEPIHTSCSEGRGWESCDNTSLGIKTNVSSKNSSPNVHAIQNLEIMSPAVSLSGHSRIPRF